MELAYHKQAERYLTQALNMRTQLLGETHPEVASSLNHLGIFYQKNCDFVRAKNCFIKAFEIIKEQDQAKDMSISYSDCSNNSDSESAEGQLSSVSSFSL